MNRTELVRFFVEEITPFQLMKPWHGIAERKWNRDTVVTVIVPFNLVWRLYRSLEEFVRYPARSAYERNQKYSHKGVSE